MTVRFTASVSMMFRELPLLERFSAAAGAGFGGVEVQFIDEGDPAEMASAAADASIPVVLTNLPLGDLMTGGNGLSGVPGREAEFAEEAERGLRAAKELGASFVHIGPSRLPSSVDRGECLDAYSRNIRKALDLCEGMDLDVVLLVEQSNPVDMPDPLFGSIDEAATMVEAVGSKRFRLLFDLYHLAMTGRDALDAWSRWGRLAPHVQFSDMPGRHEPGTGVTNIRGDLSGIRSSGYAGWFGAEYRPAGRTLDGLDWLREFRSDLA